MLKRCEKTKEWEKYFELFTPPLTKSMKGEKSIRK